MTCEISCDRVFDHILILPLIRGGTRVSWRLHSQLRDAGPYQFQLQFGRTSNPDADDWENVGPAVYDTYYADDPKQRIYGMQNRAFYRVILTTGVADYYSQPTNIFDSFDFANSQRIKNLMAQESLRLKTAGSEGFILTRRIYGEPCPVCVDLLTGESRKAGCTTCYDTGILGGYFEPYRCVWLEYTNKEIREHISEVGTQNDGPVVAARLLNQPVINSYDVWVDKSNDTRWIIHKIKSEVEVQGWPVILSPVEIRLAPFSDVIYKLPIQDHHA